jgi:glycosyltransferase involved in cell wall biosynthesis
LIKLAYFSPLNPIRSGISDYSEDLLPHLGDLVEIDLFIDDFRPANGALIERFPTYPIGEYPARRWDYDVALYHMGNNLYHEAIYRTALQFPGVVVLHDYALVGVISSMTWGREDRGGFIREWGYNYGREGVAKARNILDGLEAQPADEPLNRRLIESSLGLVVHSDYVRRQILMTAPLARIFRVPMPWVSHAAGGMTRQSARQELGLEEDGQYIGCFGFMAPSKQIEPLLDVLSELSSRFPAACLLFVGEPLSWYDPEPLIQERDLADRVTITGYIPLSTWYAYIKAVDLAVNLRYPTLGETSASVLRLLGEGVPTVVSDVGWYAELPDDGVIKVAVGESMRGELAAAVAELLRDPQRRAELGQNGRSHVVAEHGVQEVARRYAAVLEQRLGSYALELVDG